MNEVRRNRNILIAVDMSDNSARAVSYAKDLLEDLPGFRITLLTIVQVPSEDYFPAESEREAWIDEQKAVAEGVLKSHEALLTGAGFRKESIECRIIAKECASLAECILEEQQKLDCGTVVIGRRGISRKEEFLFGSTSNKILHASRECSVWVVE
jgi:nucleotide-binding universal stress UspA family protein